jgi:hypothetical protein
MKNHAPPATARNRSRARVSRRAQQDRNNAKPIHPRERKVVKMKKFLLVGLLAISIAAFAAPAAASETVDRPFGWHTVQTIAPRTSEVVAEAADPTGRPWTLIDLFWWLRR